MARQKRQGPSKKLRFEVFKRDKFTCQYCGRSAPDVMLEVDHIQPVSKDGDNDILNLVTSCRDCNAGKGPRELTDEAALAKQRQQLAELQERREQLQMMMEWQRELSNLDAETVDQLADLWAELVEGYSLNDNGRHTLAKIAQQYNVAEIGDAMRKAITQKLETDAGGAYTKESVEAAFDYVGRICRFQRQNADKPYMRDLFYVRGILKNRLSYLNQWQAIQLMEQAYLNGAEVEDLRGLALEARSWTQWRNTITDVWLGENAGA